MPIIPNLKNVRSLDFQFELLVIINYENELATSALLKLIHDSSCHNLMSSSWECNYFMIGEFAVRINRV